MGKVTVVGGKIRMEAPVTFDPVFANNDWKTVVKACQTNKVPDTWVVGSQKTMTIDGVNYPIDIIGKNHDEYSDGSGKAPLTFQMHDLYDTAKSMNGSNTNSGGWEGCAMRKTHLPAIMTLMPSEVQSGIKEVNKLTSKGLKDSTIVTTADKLFLLSEVEVTSYTNDTAWGEGTQYAYYKAGNDKKKVHHTSKGKNYWWYRSPYRSDSSRFTQMNVDGVTVYNTASQSAGVTFAFCF